VEAAVEMGVESPSQLHTDGHTGRLKRPTERATQERSPRKGQERPIGGGVAGLGLEPPPLKVRVDQKNLRFKPDCQSFEANRGAEGERSLEFGAHAGNWIRPSWAADTSLMPFS
jgi:hypothetical protein